KIEVRCGELPPQIATVKTASSNTDLAVLRIPIRVENYLTFAPKKSATLGTRVLSVGYPLSDVLGTQPKYTEGTKEQSVAYLVPLMKAAFYKRNEGSSRINPTCNVDRQTIAIHPCQEYRIREADLWNGGCLYTDSTRPRYGGYESFVCLIGCHTG